MSRTGSDGSGTVLFDLDGVLTHQDTMAALVRRRLLSSPLRLLGALPALVTFAVLQGMPRVSGSPARWIVHAALRGMSMQGYETWARAAGRAFALAEDWRVPEAILRVQEHQRRGDDVHLVTASELTLVSAYLEGIGLAGVTIHASRLEKGASGIRFSWHNYGARKVMTLRGQGVRIADALLYTDSAADLPLALHTGEAVLVNPHPRDIRHFRRAGLEPRIERWS